MNRTAYVLTAGAILLICLAVLPFLAVQTARAADNSAQTAQAGSGLGDDIPDWQARLELARVLSYVKRYEESLAEYQKVLKEKPDQATAKIEMAKVLFWNGQEEEALKILAQADPAQLTDEERLVLADLYAARKDYDQAVAIYEISLKKNPVDHNTRLKLAEVLAWSQLYDRSIAEFETILQALPKDTQVRRKYAFVLIWADKRDRAIAELRKSLND